MRKIFPCRPPRLRTVFSNLKPIFFITFNTYKHIPILARQEIHSDFIHFCSGAGERGIPVGYYVIMPDHIHLFVWCDTQESSLQQWVKAMKSYLGKRLLKLSVKKPHWQEGFFDHLLRHAESYREKSQYVMMNPVRAGLCAKPEDWPYSGKISDLDM